MNNQRDKLPTATFWDHIDALRSVLLRAGGVVLLLTVVFFALMPQIFDTVILAPASADFFLFQWLGSMPQSPLMPDFSSDTFHVDIINIQLASQFFIHMSTSFWLAVIFAFPIIIYLLWGFVAPGLYPDEKRGIKKAFLLGNLMFFLGVAVGYCIVFPITLRFLADYHVSQQITNHISLDSYMDNFLMLILIMGLVFELPLVAMILGRIGLLTRAFFGRFRRHAIAVLLIVAAAITPTGDPFTLMVVFIPIYTLWELSAWLVPHPIPDPSTPDTPDR